MSEKIKIFSGRTEEEVENEYGAWMTENPHIKIYERRFSVWAGPADSFGADGTRLLVVLTGYSIAIFYEAENK
jgi:hypothetical protein